MSAEWPSVQISDMCELIIDCVNKTAKVVDGPTPYKMIRTSNVRDGWVDTINVRYVEEDTYKKWTRRGEPRNGDVILTREAPLGEVGLLRDARGIFLGQRLVMYRANPTKLDNWFLLYSLLGHDLQAQIKAFGSGSTVEHMRVPDCEKLILQLPPLETQQRIGSILSAYDDLIENNSRRIKILGEMARMIYREWFVNFRFPGHEKVKMVDSPFGQIPEGWEFTKVGDLLGKIPRKKKVQKQDYLNSGEIPVVDQGKDFIGGYTSDEEALTETPLPLIVFGDHTRALKYIDFPFASGADGTQLLRANTPRMPAPLFYYALQEVDLTNFAYARHFKFLKEEVLVVPDQQAADVFEKHVGKIRVQIRCLDKKNQNLRQTRDLLLPKLISGEVYV